MECDRVTKIVCRRFECEVCRVVDLVQIFLRSDGTPKYARARHYKGKKSGKPQFEYHQQSLQYVASKIGTLTEETSYHKDSISKEADSGQLGHNDSAKNIDLDKAESSCSLKFGGWSSSLVRTLALRAKGRRSESGSAHHNLLTNSS
jgi:hypothetical protein